MRKTIIAVIGRNGIPQAVAEDARRVGAAIADCQEILLTGGKCINSDNVKDAAMHGVKHGPDEGPRQQKLRADCNEIVMMKESEPVKSNTPWTKPTSL
jgi:hypothetical protein